MIRRLFRCTLAAAVLVALVVGVPVLLIRFGPGLPHTYPSLSQLRHVAGTALSDDAVFAVLTIAAWLAWAAFTVAVIVEIIAELRGVARPKLPIPSPFQSASRGLVAALLMTVAVAGPFASSRMQVAPALTPPSTTPTPMTSTTMETTSLTTSPSTPPAQPLQALQAPVASPVQVAPSLPTISVAPGDSPWALADRHLATGQRWRELWDLNKGLPQPGGQAWVVEDLIEPGWTLRLPADATNVPPSAPALTGSPPLAPQTYVVRPGDTLSQIAAGQMGDPARTQELFDANTALVQPDGRQLTDPNFILPGWTLLIPAGTPIPAHAAQAPTASPRISVPDTLPSNTSTPPAPPTTAPEVSSSPTVPDSLPASAASVPTTSITLPTAAATPTSAAPATTSATAAMRNGRISDSTPGAEKKGNPIPSQLEKQRPVEQADDSILPATAPLVVGISGATVLATCLGLLVNRKRRRQAAHGARHGRILDRAGDIGMANLEAAMISAGDLPLVRWAGQELARLVMGLNPKRISGVPMAVELSEEAGIELLWDTPQPDAPDPWVAADGGWAWRRSYDPDAEVPSDDLPAAIPALVTVGQRDGRQLLLNLEAVGSLAVSGDDAAVTAFIRAITLELGSDEELADAAVTLAGVEVDGTELLDRVASWRVDDVQAPLAAMSRSIGSALDTAGLPSTFAYRMGPRGGHLEATVAIIDPIYAQLRDDLLEMALPHRGLSVVLAGDVQAAGAGLHIDADGRARLEPLGLEFCAASVPASTAANLQRLLASEDPEPERPAVDTKQCAKAQAIDLTELSEFDPHLTTLTNGRSTNGHSSVDGRGTAVEEAPMLHIVTPANGGSSNALMPDDNAAPLASSQNTSGPDKTEATPDFEAEGSVELERGTAESGLIKPELLVRVLGVPSIPDRPALNRRQLILAVYLASRGGSCSASGVQDAVWNGKAVQDKTLWNLVSRTRTALGLFDDGGQVMPQADRPTNTLRLADGVGTDVDVLRDRYEAAQTSSSAEAIALLSEGLDLIEGPPFDAAGYDWAHHTHQLVAEASALIERATERLVALALDEGDIETARHGLVQGLRGLPGNEVLYRLRMTLEHDAGNLAAIKGAYVELLGFLADLESDPSEATVELYECFTRPARLSGHRT